MKCRELIEMLQELPEDAEVTIYDERVDDYVPVGDRTFDKDLNTVYLITEND